MPPERRIELLLLDIIERADAVLAAVEGLGEEDLHRNDTPRSAVLWSLSIIGEAANRLPQTFCTDHPEVAWPRLVGFRNFVLHTYEQIDVSLLWVVIEQVPALRGQVLAILRTEHPLAAQALDEHGSESS